MPSAIVVDHLRVSQVMLLLVGSLHWYSYKFTGLILYDLIVGTEYMIKFLGLVFVFPNRVAFNSIHSFKPNDLHIG